MTGKEVFENPDTGIRVVYDPDGDYFRIQDPEAHRANEYLDIYGNQLPNNIPLVRDGKTAQTGIPRDVRNALTHFRNQDKKDG